MLELLGLNKGEGWRGEGGRCLDRYLGLNKGKGLRREGRGWDLLG